MRTESNNEIITDWWLKVNGYADEKVYEGMGRHYVNPTTQEGMQLGPIPIPKWDSSAAWTPELYQAIEDAGLSGKFIDNLDYDINGCDSAARDAFASLDRKIDINNLIKATPAQKATALSRAIQEVG